jgi:hypothetical protein
MNEAKGDHPQPQQAVKQRIIDSNYSIPKRGSNILIKKRTRLTAQTASRMN